MRVCLDGLIDRFIDHLVNHDTRELTSIATMDE